MRAMVHHVTRTYAMEPQRLGSVKLHKILWWTEIRCLQTLGRAASGETFQKEEFGPFSRHLGETVEGLSRSGALHVRKGSGGFDPDIYVGKGQPDTSLLSEEEWRVLDQVADWVVNDHSAGSISEKSHGPVWEAVNLHEPMPVGAAALQWLPISKQDKAQTRERLDS